MASYSGFTHKKKVIFHSYVKLPEGNHHSHEEEGHTPEIDAKF